MKENSTESDEHRPITRSMTKQQAVSVNPISTKVVTFADNPTNSQREAIQYDEVSERYITPIPTLSVLLGNAAACLPDRVTPDSAGLDLYSAEKKLIKSKSWELIDTSIHIEIPKGHLGFLTARSGLAAKNGITTLCGTIDSDYVGPIKIVLMNH
ncbi:MAG: hypothetical protein GY816_10105, partial [Cytophagales bacterium]|nr:hypothetical protein [Cytophagales bacterium]